MTATPSWSYRPGLDGVRAVAILLVMAHHFHMPFPQSGRLGVTMFFVLSGYLITGLLIAEQRRTGTVDLRAFYIRRARRLLPALFALVAGVLAIAAFHGELLEVMPAAAASSFYYANVAHQLGIDLGLLSHTWSLAYEEQFYVWWPLAFIALIAWRPQWAGRAVIVTVALLIGVKAGMWITGTGFWTPFDRADSLLAGAALAVYGVRGVRFLLPLGLLLASWLSVIPDAQIGSWTYLAATGVSVLIVAGADGTRLGWAPLAFIGQISYSLYLWHIPATRELDRLTGAWWPVLLPFYIALTAALALASYYWIERPFRTRPSALRSHPIHAEARAVFRTRPSGQRGSVHERPSL